MKKKANKTPRKRNKKKVIDKNQLDLFDALSDRELLEIVDSDLEKELNKKNKNKKRNKKKKPLRRPKKAQKGRFPARKKNLNKNKKRNDLISLLKKIIKQYRENKPEKELKEVYQAINQSLANEVQDSIIDLNVRYFVSYGNHVREIESINLFELRSFTFNFMDWFIEKAVELEHTESPYVLWNFYINEKQKFRILFLPPTLHPDQLNFEDYAEEIQFKLGDISNPIK